VAEQKRSQSLSCIGLTVSGGNKTATHEGRCLCLYDNAGESFEPGAENEDNPVTRHMAKADTLLFVYDPTQETAFRRACAEKSSDPQWRGQARGGSNRSLH